MATRHWLTSLWSEEHRSEPLGQLHREIDRMFDEFMGSGRSVTAGNGGIVMAPRVDLAETDDSIEITAGRSPRCWKVAPGGVGFLSRSSVDSYQGFQSQLQLTVRA